MNKLFLIIFILLLAGSFLYAGSGETGDAVEIKPYGFVRYEAIYDMHESAVGDWHLFTYPGNDPRAQNDLFTSTARATRLGIKMSAPKVSDILKINGLVEVDFEGGFPNSSTAARQPQLRLRHAWAEVQSANWAIRLGQDWALISGPFPNTTSFVVGAGKGNLWMRLPQVRFKYDINKFSYAVSVNRPMAGNVKYNDFAGGDFDPVGDGERSAVPWLMGRLWYNFSAGTFSVSGHYGNEKINDLSGSPHTKSSYSVNGDIRVKFNPVRLTARVFSGENLNTFFGGVFQGFFADSVSITNVRSSGGWLQLEYFVNNTWIVTVGAGQDDPRDKEIPVTKRTKNQWVWGNISYAMSKHLKFMVESTYLKTEYKNLPDGDNIRFQFLTLFLF